MWLICGAGSVLLSGSVVFLYRWKTRKYLKTIRENIEDAIAGKEWNASYTESLNSAIGEKLDRFLTIQQERTEQSLKEKEILKTYLSDISHQTKTPLTNIVLYSQLLCERQEIDGKSRRMAEKIKEQAEQLEFLVRTLAKASYQELGMITIHKQEESLDRLILESLDSFYDRMKEKRIRAEYTPSGAQCRCDYVWTKEVLENLLDNAVKYSGEDTTIRIQVILYEMFVRIDVTDEGIGIPEEEQGAVFQRFYRSDKVKNLEGLGIGLYLVREILTRQEGYVEVSSEVGKGSTFSVFLKK